MSANAGSWFYSQPEEQAYLIAERVNGSFWQARVYEVYWTCTKETAPYQCVGVLPSGKPIFLEWEASKWLGIKAPRDVDLSHIVDMVAQRVLMMPASVTYLDSDGNRGYEWHLEGGQDRWGKIQGVARYSQLERLN